MPQKHNALAAMQIPAVQYMKQIQTGETDGPHSSRINIGLRVEVFSGDSGSASDLLDETRTRRWFFGHFVQ